MAPFPKMDNDMDQICRVLVTGANGFIGKNIVLRLSELPKFRVTKFVRGDDYDTLPELISEVDAVIHLAGENRPQDPDDFDKVNCGLTERLCCAIRKVAETSKRKVVLVLASSTQANLKNPYGMSKLKAEYAVEVMAKELDSSVVVFRLPGVFGKWCKPHYNSVVATFCHQVSRNLPIQVSNSSSLLKLAYIDDVVSAMIKVIRAPMPGLTMGEVAPEYSITLGELADQIKSFENCRTSLISQCVGTGLVRALYATYISYLPNHRFKYEVPQYGDQRGQFVEFLKTVDSGQFSFFTAHPNITRGGHYHHTKSEKFLVIKGQALFRFRHILTEEIIEIHTSGSKTEVVDTVPGWSHDITNIGDDELVVMLWANENFDREKPDTIMSKV